MTPATVVRGLIDTPILIDYREGEPDAAQLMADLRQLGLPDTSQVSVLVLFARCRDDHERDGVHVFLRISTVHKVGALTTRRAQQILEQVPMPTTLTADDAVVAATAIEIEHKLPLYTLDPARFAGVAGLTATQPY